MSTLIKQFTTLQQKHLLFNKSTPTTFTSRLSQTIIDKLMLVLHYMCLQSIWNQIYKNAYHNFAFIS